MSNDLEGLPLQRRDAQAQAALDDIDPHLLQDLQTCLKGRRDMGGGQASWQLWEQMFKLVGAATGQVSIPCLKFTVKRRETKKQNGTLLNIELPRLHGIKVVRTVHNREQEQCANSVLTPRIVDFPGPEDKICPGDECWILPILDNFVQMKSCPYFQHRLRQVRDRLLQAYDRLYTADETGRATVVCNKLKSFVDLFARDAEVVLDWLPVRWYMYPAEASPAAVCTKSQAKPLLERVADNEQFWHRFLDEEAHVLKLLYMNMRHTFGVSPVAVIHGDGRNECRDWYAGAWEMPERCTTVVFPGDRLVFLEPADVSLKRRVEEMCHDRVTSLEYIRRLSCWTRPVLLSLGPLPPEGRHSDLLELLMAAMAPNAVRPATRRGHRSQDQ